MDTPDAVPGLAATERDGAALPEAGRPPPFVELDGVMKSYGPVAALGPVTLRIPSGCTALLGPNGAGKSTLLRILLGLVTPQAGTVSLMGCRVRPGLRTARRRIGYAPEGDALFPDLTGSEAVAYAGRLSGMPATAAIQRSHQVLDYVGLGEERYRQASTYSAGMRQRLKFAQAIVHDPDALILDEPTEAVDPSSRRDLLELIRDLSRNHGVPVLLSTHLLADAESVATHAVVLDRGQVVAQGTLEDLKRPAEQGFFVRVDGDAAALAARLVASGAQCVGRRGGLQVSGAGPQDILRASQEAGLVVRHLAPTQLSLHEAFRQAIGGAHG